MSQILAVPISSANHPVGTGGFLDPDRIVNEFNIREGMQIAEFGSGAGFFVIPIAERAGSGGKVYALDIMEEKLDSVRAKARVRNLTNIETIRTNLEIPGSSSLAGESLDFVLLANILFQSSKKSEIINEAVRILKKDGVLVIIDWKKGTGGFGPPDTTRTDNSDMSSLAQKSNLILKGKLDAGQFHYGLVFTKG